MEKQYQEDKQPNIGTDQEFTMNIVSTGIPKENIKNTLTAGRIYSIELNCSDVS